MTYKCLQVPPLTFEERRTLWFSKQSSSFKSSMWLFKPQINFLGIWTGSEPSNVRLLFEIATTSRHIKAHKLTSVSLNPKPPKHVVKFEIGWFRQYFLTLDFGGSQKRTPKYLGILLFFGQHTG